MFDGLVGHEAVEILEAHPRRPLVERPGDTVLIGGRVVVLAEPRGGITVLLQDLANAGILQADDRLVARVTSREFADHTGADGVMVATRYQRRPGGRAEGRRVELDVAQSRLSDAVQCERRDDAAER